LEPEDEGSSSSDKVARYGISTKSRIFLAFAVRCRAEVRNPRGENIQMLFCKNFEHKLDSNYWQANKVSGKSSFFAEKKS